MFYQQEFRLSRKKLDGLGFQSFVVVRLDYLLMGTEMLPATRCLRARVYHNKQPLAIVSCTFHIHRVCWYGESGIATINGILMDRKLGKNLELTMQFQELTIFAQ